MSDGCRCCVSDGGLALAGGEAGVAVLWDVAFLYASGPASVAGGGPAVAPSPEGLYPPWSLRGTPGRSDGCAPINGLAVLGSPGDGLRMAFALDDGFVALTQL